MTARLEEARRLLRLAQRDHAAFEALAGSAQPELFAAACFHAQQAVEKALKAAMSLYGIEFRRTHDLEELAGQLADAGVALPEVRDMLPRLTPYAVQRRLVMHHDRNTAVSVAWIWLAEARILAARLTAGT